MSATAAERSALRKIAETRRAPLRERAVILTDDEAKAIADLAKERDRLAAESCRMPDEG